MRSCRVLLNSARSNGLSILIFEGLIFDSNSGDEGREEIGVVAKELYPDEFDEES
jgi:hypothetical protein